jgi:hypothetical protein
MRPRRRHVISPEGLGSCWYGQHLDQAWQRRIGAVSVDSMTKLLTEVSTRIEVASLEDALPTYRKLAGSDDVRRLEFPEFDLAIVGPFLLLEGEPETLAKFHRSATLIVTDLAAAVEAFTEVGGSVLDGPTASGGGTRTIVKDRDGNVFECYRPAVH